MRLRRRFVAALSSLLLLAIGLGASATAQSAQAVAATARISAAVNPAQTVRMEGRLPSWAVAANDQGALSPSRQLTGLHLVLQRAPLVEAAFQQLLLDQQNPASPRYHQWLTPAENAAQYGIAASDLAAVTGWLRSMGLTVDDVAAGGVFLTFSGPVSAVQTAFATEIHSFATGKATRYAATAQPAIPSALSGVIKAVSGLTETTLQPHLRSGAAKTLAAIGKGDSGAKPLVTFSSTDHALGPGDFAVIYDINSVYKSGITGTGNHVMIIGGSRIAPADITNYETLFGLASYQPNTIVLPNTGDPGLTGDDNQVEATLDFDRVYGTAPGAPVDLIISSGGLSDTTIQSEIQYDISTLNDPIINMSFGDCETSSDATRVSTYDTYFATAAAQGIAFYISSGDDGAAGCDADYNTIPTPQVLAENVLCASSHITCVGGTEFSDLTNPALYWSSSNSATGVSALSYIPEGAWNDPSYENQNSQIEYEAASTGGGVSLFIAKPSWQTGTGVPNDGHRDTPDVSFSASNNEDPYVVCISIYDSVDKVTPDCTQYVALYGGTSASAPGMAGVAALLNQKLGKTQGNLNALLYKLAATTTNGVFHDATPASSGVASCSVTTPSTCNNSTPTNTSLTGGLAGYALTTGYDQATGLGSLDVANFLTAAVTAAAPTVSTTLVVTASGNPITTSQGVVFTATLTPGATTPAATGTVQFYSNGTALGSPVTLAGNVAVSPSEIFPTAGSYNITAIYSGDATFITSTAAALPLVVTTGATFSVTPAATALSLVSGATSGNTDAITVASLNSFAGTVNLACTVASSSGTAAGTCSLAPASPVLTAGGSVASLLTINTTPGTSGTLTVTLSATSTATTAPPSAVTITVTLTASSFTLTAAPATLSLLAGATTGNTSQVTVTSVNGFAGSVALTCTTAVKTGAPTASCAVSPTTVTLTAGGTATTTATITSTAGTSGSLTATVSGIGTATGATLATSTTVPIAVALTGPSFTIAPSPATLNLSAGATTGNTSTVTLTSTNAFAGTVALTCAAALANGGTASLAPTCTLVPTSVTLSSGSTATSVVTIGTQVASSTCTAAAAPSLWPTGGGALLALTLLVLPLRKRRGFKGLLLALLLSAGFAGLSGCGESNSSTPCSTVVKAGTTTGTYNVVITGTSSTTASTGTLTLTVN